MTRPKAKIHYYLVSEEELEELKEAAFYEASLVFLNDEPTNRLDRAMHACRSRPQPCHFDVDL